MTGVEATVWIVGLCCATAIVLVLILAWAGRNSAPVEPPVKDAEPLWIIPPKP